jgi:hypothetical protein
MVVEFVFHFGQLSADGSARDEMDAILALRGCRSCWHQAGQKGEVGAGYVDGMHPASQPASSLLAHKKRVDCIRRRIYPPL